MIASVIIATRNRPHELETCLDALRAQTSARPYEVIVVDDGSVPPVCLPTDPRLRCVRSPSSGPAAARNLGIRVAHGDVILFTDDDTLPAPNWIESACAFLDAHPVHRGVEGPTVSRPVDALYEHTVTNDGPGAWWTCNVAYRRSALEAIGGFCERFRWPHGEDVDLALRIQRLGPIGFSTEMAVVHTPRHVSLAQLVMQSRFVVSDLFLYFRYPDRYRERFAVPRRMFPLVNVLRRWWQYLRTQNWTLMKSPRRLSRFLLAATGQLLVAAVIVAVPRRLGLE
jgi:GT2 family glycosyltransferase